MIDRSRFAPIDILSYQENGEQYFTVQIIAGGEGLEQAEMFFGQHENYRDGQGWVGLITCFLRKEDPDFLERMDLDGGPDAFSATLETAEDMLKLAAMLQNLISNAPKMTKLLDQLPEDWREA